DEKLEASFAARNEGKRAAIRRDARADVVVAAESHALRFAARQSQAVDLRTAAAIAGEVEVLPIRREIRLGIDAHAARQALQSAAAVGIDGINLRKSVAGQGDGQ